MAAMGLLWGCYETAMRLLWDCHGTAIEQLWDCYGTAMPVIRAWAAMLAVWDGGGYGQPCWLYGSHQGVCMGLYAVCVRCYGIVMGLYVGGGVGCMGLRGTVLGCVELYGAVWGCTWG